MKASVQDSLSPVTEVVVLRRRVPTTTDRLVSIRPAAVEPESASPASEVRTVPAPARPARTRVQMVVSRPVPASAVPVAAARMAGVETPAVPAKHASADEALGVLTRLQERRADLLCLALLEPATG